MGNPHLTTARTGPGTASPAVPDTVDLYRLRCAVAVVVDCAQRGGHIDRGELRRFDYALWVLANLRAGPGAPLRRAVDRLLSSTADPDGARTLAAVAELAALTHVEARAAPALAAALLPAGEAVQGSLFEPGPGPTRT